MAKQVINASESGTVVRGKLNDNFDELYALPVAGVAASQTEVDTNVAGSIFVSPSTLRLSRPVNVAILLGDLTGNARGAVALDIQTTRSSITQVASGANALAVGWDNIASGNTATAVGAANAVLTQNAVVVGRSNFTHTSGVAAVMFGVMNNQTGGSLNTSSGLITGTPTAAASVGVLTTAIGIRNSTGNNRATAVGYNNTANGVYSAAIGYINTASDSCSAVGHINTASSTYSSAFGYKNTASASRAMAMGFFNTASSNYASAVGSTNVASAMYTTAIGFRNTVPALNGVAMGRSNFTNTTGLASVAVGLLNNQTGGTLNAATGVISGTPVAGTVGRLSTAVGVGNTASGNYSSVVGCRVKTTVAKTAELGYWNDGTTRSSAVRMHGETGMVSATIQNRATAYTDGGTTAGSEADNTLGREMYTLRRNGDVLIIDINVAGTIKSLSLGTAT